MKCSNCFSLWHVVVQIILQISLSFSLHCKQVPVTDHVCTDPGLNSLNRLPQNIRPIHYNLKYLFHSDLNYFEATARIHIHVINETDKLFLHSDSLKILSIAIYHTSNISSNIIPRKMCTVPNNSMFVILFTSKLPSGSKLNISITFQNDITDGLNGIYYVDYENSEGNNKRMVVTHFEPDHARSAFPCFDEPNLKASFQVTIIHSKNRKATSNTPIYLRKRYNDSHTVTTFQITPIMSTYLLAFTVHDFEFITTKYKDRVEVSVYLPLNLINYGKYALLLSQKVLSMCEELFQINYPLKKLDLFGIPNFEAGAMENWGLMTFRMESLLYYPNVTMNIEKRYVTQTIVHEISHQWFGNLVTMKWWNDLWLNEGFATFMEYYGTDKIFPEWRVMESFLTDDVYSAMKYEHSSITLPISTNEKEITNLRLIFNSIVYSKAAAIIAMLHGYLSDETFFKCIGKYLKRYSYSNAKADDLWEVMNEETHETDFVETINKWTRKSGFPVINVVFDRYRGTAQLYQSRFRPASLDSSSEKSETPWIIPLKYITSNNNQEVALWLKKSNDSFEIELPGTDSWILLNSNGKSYCRIFYDSDTLNVYAQQLKKNYQIFSTVNRVGLISDSFTATSRGDTLINETLSLLEYIYLEQFYLPWHEATYIFTFVDDMLTQRKTRALYRRYIRNLLSKYTPSNISKENRYLKQNLRNTFTFLCLHFSCPKTVNRLRKQYLSWKENNTDINKEEFEAALCSGIKYGNKTDWDTVLRKYFSTSDPIMKIRFVYALTCSRNSLLLNDLLMITLNTSAILSQESPHIIRSIALNHDGRKVAWEFLNNNWNRIVKMHEKATPLLGNIVKGVIGHMVSPELKNQINDFIAKNLIVEIADSFAQAIEVYQHNLMWNELNLQSLNNWLTKRKNTTNIKINKI